LRYTHVITSSKLCQRHQQGLRREGEKNKENGAKGCQALSKQAHLLIDKKAQTQKGNKENLLNAIIIKKKYMQEKREIKKNKRSTHIFATSITPSRHVISDSFNFSISLSKPLIQSFDKEKGPQAKR